MSLPGFLRKIMDWLHAGYPEGVPGPDYFPLFALVSRDMSEEDVTAFAEELASTSDEDTAKIIKEARASSASVIPADSDLARVRARLAAGGWPLWPEHSGPDEPGAPSG
jgi:hypothetical protein